MCCPVLQESPELFQEVCPPEQVPLAFPLLENAMAHAMRDAILGDPKKRDLQRAGGRSCFAKKVGTKNA